MTKAGCTLGVLLFLGSAAHQMAGQDIERWVPARWSGGPVELARRPKDKAPTAEAREAIEKWYQPATLDLLKDTPVNCLLVTLSAGAPAEIEKQQLQLVKEYARLAKERNLSVLGIVHPGAEASAVATAVADATLAGVVLDGEFAADFTAKLSAALQASNSSALVIPIAKDAAAVRTAKERLIAINGVRPTARDLAEMGIRAGPSSEPWIDSNIWLVRSFRLETTPKTIWISQEPDPSSVGDYVRGVADAAVAGGRLIVTLDDNLRAKLYKKDASGIAILKAISTYLRFAEDHCDWRGFLPYGNLGIILDAAGENTDVSNEYLNLVARRQVPYRIIERRQLTAKSLDGFRAVLAADLAPPTEPEKALLTTFAERSNLLIGGPAWGKPEADTPYTESSLGKGRLVVYKDDPPDPEGVARDMLDLLSADEMGVTAFNVPSVLTYASTAPSGSQMLVQLLNYAGTPFDQRVTVRVNGVYKTAHLFTPEEAPVDVATRTMGTRTEVSIPKLAAWGALLFE